MSKECGAPQALQEQHIEDIKALYALSFPAWVRDTMLALMGLLFVCYAGLWFYCASTYATRDDVKEMRVEIRQDMKEIKEKIDMLKAKP